MGEENDAWVKRIAPLFEYYTVQPLFKIVGVEILVPFPCLAPKGAIHGE
jgi:hypothetical protein